jgi:hypothetical protein
MSHSDELVTRLIYKATVSLTRRTNINHTYVIFKMQVTFQNKLIFKSLTNLSWLKKILTYLWHWHSRYNNDEWHFKSNHFCYSFREFKQYYEYSFLRIRNSQILGKHIHQQRTVQAWFSFVTTNYIFFCWCLKVTNSMEESSFWEVNSSSTSQHIPCIL